MTDLTIIKSASIILQKTTGEVYLVRRSRNVSFFPTFWVFPGGKIEEDIDDKWEGTEFEVIETVFQELYEEVGVIVGGEHVIPPEKRKEPYFVHDYDDHKRKQFKEAMIYIGKKQTPPFRRKLYNAAYFWIQHELVDELEPVVDGEELDKGEWVHPADAVKQWAQGNRRLPPPILHLLRNIASPHFDAITLSETQLPVGLQTKVEFAPGYQAIPIESNTIEPFFNTNLVVIGTENYLIVDPGANQRAKSHLRQILLSLPTEPLVFISHHHQDHWAGLDVVEELFPDTEVVAHPKTLSRISTGLSTRALSDGEDLKIGDHQLQFLFTPGHTDGHGCLWDSQGRILVAGDHVVGYGSAVLDPSNGSMIDYFATTRRLIELGPKLILPAHGPPNFAGKRLLEHYLDHRTQREDNILKAIEQGAQTLDHIVEQVYTDVPQRMWSYAKRNIQLHIEKLRHEGRLPEQYSG